MNVIDSFHVSGIKFERFCISVSMSLAQSHQSMKIVNITFPLATIGVLAPVSVHVYTLLGPPSIPAEIFRPTRPPSIFLFSF